MVFTDSETGRRNSLQCGASSAGLMKDKLLKPPETESYLEIYSVARQVLISPRVLMPAHLYFHERFRIFFLAEGHVGLLILRSTELLTLYFFIDLIARGHTYYRIFKYCQRCYLKYHIQ